MAQKRGSLGFLSKGPSAFFSSNTGSFTLHSDQSFPGTPSQLCSRTGTDPERRKYKFEFHFKCCERVVNGSKHGGD